jgi:hypothetical protein
MANRTFIYQVNDVIKSFSTLHPQALTNKVPWVITRDTPMSEALSRIFDQGFADLLVIDAKTGQVQGLLSDFDTTTSLSSKKKKEKKAVELLGLQEQCAQMCNASCANQGGCRSHGIANFGNGWTCVIECNSAGGGLGTVGGALDQATPL